jgi:DNA-binding Xre family transcriptional regulator
MIQNNIKKLLDERKLSVNKFVKETGIAFRTGYDLYNTPSRLPNVNVLEKICDTYNIQPGELLTWIPTQKPNIEIYNHCFIVYDDSIDWVKEIQNMDSEIKESTFPLVIISKDNGCYEINQLDERTTKLDFDYTISYRKLDRAEKARTKTPTTWGGEKTHGGNDPVKPSVLTPKDVIDIMFRAENLKQLLMEKELQAMNNPLVFLSKN